MRAKTKTIAFGLLVLVIVQLACALPSRNDDEAPAEITVPLGPQLSETEHQTQVLERIFTNIENVYINNDTSNVDLNALRKTYQAEIEKGLSTAEFNELMSKLEGEFPQGDIIYAGREERIESDMAADTAGYGGIGAFVSFQAEDEPHVVILDVIPGSPAEKAGLKAHDSIYAVDGEPVRLDEGSNVVLRIRGEAGTKVVLTVRTPGKAEREVELTRAQINGIGEMVADEIPGTDIGYIRMPTVGSTTLVDDFVSVLESFAQNSNLKGIIIDLRVTGQNANFPLEEMLTIFTNNIKVEIYSLKDSETFTVEGQDFSGSQEIPLVVLVGENTSGPAEVFAAAVQGNDRGIVIGGNTAGAIEAFTGFPLPNGGQIAIASASFRIGGVEGLGIEGLSPEVRVEARWDEIVAGEDPVIQQAIQSFEVEVEE